jgi:hypothetical protein
MNFVVLHVQNSVKINTQTLPISSLQNIWYRCLGTYTISDLTITRMELFNPNTYQVPVIRDTTFDIIVDGRFYSNSLANNNSILVDERSHSVSCS